MPNFLPVAYFDTLELAGSLRQRWGQFKTTEPGHRALRIRGQAKDSQPEDDRFGSYPVAAKWVELANLRSEIARRAEAILPPGIEFGLIYFEMLDAGARRDWAVLDEPYYQRWSRAVLPIRTNPATLLVYGTETASPAPGWLTIVSPRLPHCAVNLGEHAWVWLVLDFRKRDAAE